MKLLIALMALFCLITYSNTAQATDWYYVSPDDKDPESIEGNMNGQAIYRLLWP